MKPPKSMRVVELETAVEIHWKLSPLFGTPTNRLQGGCGLVGLFGMLGMLLFFALGTQNGTLFAILLALLLLAGYFVLALAVNRTIIRIDREAIHISYTPLPYPGSKRYPLARLNNNRLTVERRKMYKPGGGLGSDFSVQATRKGGEPIALLKAIPDLDHAQFIASRLNQFRSEL